MTFAIVILGALFIGFLTYAVKADKDLKLLKLRERKEADDDRSLTVSELSGMIESSVRQATAQLEARLSEMETRLEQAGVPELPPAMRSAALPEGRGASFEGAREPAAQR